MSTPAPCRCAAPVTAAGGDLADAVRRHLAGVPDIRRGKVAAARHHLRVAGPPSPAVLADMLLVAMWPRCVTDQHGSAHSRL